MYELFLLYFLFFVCVFGVCIKYCPWICNSFAIENEDLESVVDMLTRFFKWNFMCNVLIVWPKQFISNLFFAIFSPFIALKLRQKQQWYTSLATKTKNTDDEKRTTWSCHHHHHHLASKDSFFGGVDSQQKRFNRIRNAAKIRQRFFLFSRLNEKCHKEKLKEITASLSYWYVRNFRYCEGLSSLYIDVIPPTLSEDKIHRFLRLFLVQNVLFAQWKIIQFCCAPFRSIWLNAITFPLKSVA